MLDWNRIKKDLLTFPPKVHNLHPPCTEIRISDVETELGVLPSEEKNMLRAFNGGELFVAGLPFMTLFGVSSDGDSLSSDWFLDRFTRKWRANMGKGGDWIIGITYYGGVLVVADGNHVNEWDSDLQRWSDLDYSFEDWWKWTVSEGNSWLSDADE